MSVHGEGSAIGEAETRVIRVLAVALGVGAVVFAPLASGDIRTQWPDAGPVWTISAMVSVYAMPVVLGVLAASRRLGPRGMRRMSGAIAVGYLLCLVTQPFAVGLGGYPLDAESPWLFGVSAIGTSAAAVAWRPIPAWIAALGVAVLIAVVRLTTGSGAVLIPALQDALYALFFTAVFTALTIVSLRASRELDRASAAGAERARQAAADRAESTERRRLAALTHDRVLVALSAAATPGTEFREAARTHARQALDDSGRMRSEPPGDGERHVRVVVARIRAVAGELAPDCFVTTDLRDDVSLPDGVAEAVIEAAAEALRNSVAHADVADGDAGARAHRSVHIRTTGAGIEISVLDDGRGFDADTIPQDRLGIRASVLARMRSTPGGAAEVVSTPGTGTRVVITWRG